MADTETKTETEIAASNGEAKATEVVEKKDETKPSNGSCPKTEEKETTEAEIPVTELNGKEHKNGTAEVKSQVNGTEIEEQEEKKESTENGSEVPSEACSIKRKSVGGEVTEVDGAKEAASSPKKAKLDEKVEESHKEAVEAKA